MYICLCNAVTDKDIAQAMKEGNNTLNELKQQLDVTNKCGQCTCEVLRMIDDHQNTQQKTATEHPRIDATVAVHVPC